MMPMAPTMPVPTKTKLGFTIEALVGGDRLDRETAKTPPSSPSVSPQPSPPPAHSRTGLYPATPTATFPVCLTGYGPPVAPTGYLGEFGGSPYYPALDLTSGQSLQHMMLTREHYAMYPWLFARHHRFLPQRGPGSESHGFILHPFRKPKRIRTAFSPSQLLKLEHAFEKNHYVVGAERKQLAQCLGLTETQVKVWFQNRRTKHKRQKQEEDQGDDATSSCQDGSHDHSEPEES